MKKSLSLIIVLFIIMALLIPFRISSPAIHADDEPEFAYEEPECQPVPECITIVSDITVKVIQGNITGNAVEAWEPFLEDPNNSYWDEMTGNFFTGTGADWIWESSHTVHPIDGDVVHFKRDFYIYRTPGIGTLYIACDNGYEVWLNGVLVGSAQLGAGWEGSDLTQAYVDWNGWQSIETYDVSSLLKKGSNALLIKAANEYMGEADGQKNGTIDTNPAGLIFKLDYCYYY